MFRTLALTAFALTLSAITAHAAEAPDPEGLWLTENKRSVIKIERCGDSICGYIAWITKGGMTADTKNPKESLKGRPMCGLQILSGFTNNPKNRKVWDGGEIYKADEGDTYSATVSVISPTSLYLHGYVGIPLFGKSQTWTRVTEKDYPSCKAER